MNDGQLQGLEMFDEAEMTVGGLSGKLNTKKRQTIMALLQTSNYPYPASACKINHLRAVAASLRVALRRRAEKDAQALKTAEKGA